MTPQYDAHPDPTIELKAIEALHNSLTQALNESDDLRNELTVANTCISELEALNTIANEALMAIAKQLGFESFSDDDVMSAIADLYDQIDGRDAALRGSAASHEDRKIEDNLTRSNSDRLSELTSIMRMVQALSDTPQDKIDGAIYLIRSVIYDAISRLDL